MSGQEQNMYALRLARDLLRAPREDAQNVLLRDIENLGGSPELLWPAGCCIYKVPHHIRRLKEEAYTPKIISIGPLHSDPGSFHNIKRYKIKYLYEMLRGKGVNLDEWMQAVREREDRVRRCYSENIGLSSDEFVKILSVDAGFILGLFWRNYYWEWPQDDNISPWWATIIQPDLLLLENQLPFFFLDELYEMTFRHRDNAGNPPSFMDLTIAYFENYKTQNAILAGINVMHFTDLIRTFYLQPGRQTPERVRVTPSTPLHAPNATKLTAAGLRLVEAQERCLLDLRFTGKTLEIPPLRVDGTTEVIFRNLLVFEQCHYHYQSYFTDYIYLLDLLIDTAEDVDVLVKNNIIISCVGDNSKNIAELFNSFGKHITPVQFNSDYSKIFGGLNKFYKSKKQYLKATLRQDYCNTPWKKWVSAGGIAVAIFTFIQAVCSLIQVIKPNGIEG